MKKTIFAIALLLISLSFLYGCTENTPAPLPQEPPEVEPAPPQEHIHSFGAWKVTNATCIKEGKKVRACACGESETEKIPPLGHKAGEWITDVAATCTDDGERYCKCVRCNSELKRETIVATGHEYAETLVYPDIEKEGYTAHVCVKCADSYDDNFVPSWGQTQYRYVINPDGISCSIMDIVFNETKEVHIPDSIDGYKVTEIGPSALEDCSEITLVRLPEGIISIGNRAFAGCSSLSELVMNDGIESIGDYAFEGCNSLISLDIPESVAKVGAYAFKDCTHLLEMDLPSVTEIPDGLFSGCFALWRVNLGQITSIGNDAFFDCICLYDIPSFEMVTYIGSYAFSYCTSLESINLGSDLRFVGASAFSYTKKLSSVNIPSIDNWFYIEFVTGDSNPLNGSATLYADGEVVDTVAVPEEVFRINEYLFYGYDELVSVRIPSTVSVLCDAAFAYCTSLESAVVNGEVKYLPYNMFSGCDSLYEVVITSPITHIFGAAFMDCKSLDEIVIPETVWYIGENAFSNCASLSDIVIPDLVSAILPGSFSGCKNLVSITLPAALKTIGASAFYGCDSLASLNIPEGTETIGNNAFDGCSDIKEITFPSTLAEIGYYAFDGCTNVEKLNISSVESFCAIVFANPEANPLYLSRNEYNNQGFLTKNAALLYVGGMLMRDLLITSDITKISDFVFWYCEGIDSVLYDGTAEELDALIASGNNPFLADARASDNVYFFSQAKPTAPGKYWYYNHLGFCCKW